MDSKYNTLYYVCPHCGTSTPVREGLHCVKCGKNVFLKPKPKKNAKRKEKRTHVRK